MTRPIQTLLALAGLALITACASENKSTSAAGQQPSAKEKMDDQYEVPPPRNDMAEVMHAKLAHAQAILEGLALGDAAQVETNSLALKRISESSDWLVTESAAYAAFSSDFRGVCDELINHAHKKDLRAMVADYGHLTNTCVACHEYLRRERAVKDIPGRISLARAVGDSLGS